MLRSMTGFGAGRATVEGEELSVELRSVNHKFCEVKSRLPRELTAFEPQAARLIKDRLARGAIELLVRRSSPTLASAAAQVDLPLAREYRRALSLIAQDLGLPDEIGVEVIASQSGVVRLEERSVNMEAAGKALEAALDQALAALLEMRAIEGEAIRADLSSRLDVLEGMAGEVAALAPRSADEYRQRLSERIAELARGVAVDPLRLAQEVAFFAERTDVAEEITRLRSHLAQFRALIASREPSGRKMDFLVQEMNREVNTTGSKSQHAEISSRIVAMKAELERIREQVQNVE